MSCNHKVWPKDRRRTLPQHLPTPGWGFKDKDFVWCIGAKVIWEKRGNYKVGRPSTRWKHWNWMHFSKSSLSIPRSQVNIKQLQEQELSRPPLDFWTDPVKHKLRQLKFRWDTTFKVCLPSTHRPIIRLSYFRFQLRHSNKTSWRWNLRLWYLEEDYGLYGIIWETLTDIGQRWKRSYEDWCGF